MEEQCSVCKIIPKVLGKNFFFRLFGREYPKLLYADVKKHFEGLAPLEVQRGFGVGLSYKNEPASRLH